VLRLTGTDSQLSAASDVRLRCNPLQGSACTDDYLHLGDQRHCGVAFSYDVDATDPDAGDACTFSLPTAPSA